MNVETILKSIQNIENIELYVIVVLIVFTLWFIFNTKKYHYNQKRKIRNLHRFAKEGEVDAQSDLAKRYQKGKQVKKDCQKSAFWYQKASFSGDEQAKGYLAKFLEKYKHKKKC